MELTLTNAGRAQCKTAEQYCGAGKSMGTGQLVHVDGVHTSRMSLTQAWSALPRRGQLRWARRGVFVLACILLCAYMLRAVVRDHNSVAGVLRRASSRGAVVVTASNFMYRAHARNFQCALQRLSLPYAPVVFSLDSRMHAFARENGMASIALSQATGDVALSGDFYGHESRLYGSIARQKLIVPALDAGLDVLVSDADIHWCGDVLKELQTMGGVYSRADVIIMAESDYHMMNSGFYFVRANERTKKLFAQLIENSKFGNHDQDVVNAVFCTEGFGAKKMEEDSVDGVPFWCRARDGAEIRVLPVDRFPSGGQVIEGKPIFKCSRERLMDMCKNMDIVVLRNNIISAGKKMARCIVKGMWFIESMAGNEEGERHAHVRCLGSAARPARWARRLCGSYC